MGVTACNADTIHKKSAHVATPNAVSLCITPAAPSPIPIPYPVIGNSAEGIIDPPSRTKIQGAVVCTVGSAFKGCHGNEPGTQKETMSFNTTGPCFPLTGAPTVLIENGMAGITGSTGFSNRGSSGSGAAAAGGAGGGGGAGGSGGGSGDGGEDGSAGGPGAGGAGGDGAGGAGAGDGGANTDREGEEAGAGGPYCPEEGTRGPPGPSMANDPNKPENDRSMAQHMDEMDLRNQSAAARAQENPLGREARIAAVHMDPGGAAGNGQAFWSGQDQVDATTGAVTSPGGRQEAQRQGYSIQEDQGGAQHLDGIGRDLPWGGEQGAGSGVTGERAWKTISMRSAENASGTVDAFVVGSARRGNVFDSVELPALLHNNDVQRIRFRDPTNPSVATTWERGGDGCWRGPSVPGGGPYNNPGFSLHGQHGFTRP